MSDYPMAVQTWGESWGVESQTSISMAQLEAAVQRLREQNIPTFEGGSYLVFVSRRTSEDVRLWEMLNGACYRLELIAEGIMRHERHRRDTGRRSTEPTAQEVFDRAWACT